MYRLPVSDDSQQVPNGHEKSEEMGESVFSRCLLSEFARLQSALLLEHDKEVAALRAENDQLQRRLLAVAATAQVGDIDLLSRTRKPPAAPAIEAAKGTTTAINGSKDACSDATTNVLSNRSDDQKIESKAHITRSPDKPSASPFRGRLSGGPHKEIEQPLSKSSSRSRAYIAMHATEGSRFSLFELVHSQRFEMLSALIITANTIIMMMNLQYDGIDIGHQLGCDSFENDAESTWPHAQQVFSVVEVAFNVIFILELTLRIVALRKAACVSGWTWFDAVVIAFSASDTFASAALPINPSMLRLLRLARLLRIIKVLRSVESCASLYLLLKAVRASMSAAIWCFGLLMAVQAVVGLFLCQLLQAILLGDYGGLPDRAAEEAVYKYYGTFSRTLLTMFEISMANWSGACRVLTENVSEWFMLLFVAYRCFFLFALLKVIAAIFISETNRVLVNDDELTIMKFEREKVLFDKKVAKFRKNFQKNNFKFEDVRDLGNDPEVTKHMTTLGMCVQDLEKLFWLLEEGAEVPVDEFVARLDSLRRPLKTIDMLTIFKLCHKIDQTMMDVFEQQGFVKAGNEDGIEGAICHF